MRRAGFACGLGALCRHSEEELCSAVVQCNEVDGWCHRKMQPEQRSVLHSELEKLKPNGHLFLEDRAWLCGELAALAELQGDSKTSHMAPGAGQPRHGDGFAAKGGREPPPFGFRMVMALSGLIRATFHLGSERLPGGGR